MRAEKLTHAKANELRLAEENLRRTRQAGSGPLAREAAASVALDRGPIQTCSGPVDDGWKARVKGHDKREQAQADEARAMARPVPQGVKVPGMVMTPNGLVRDLEKPPAPATPSNFEFIDPPRSFRAAAQKRYRELEDVCLALPPGKAFVWTNPPGMSAAHAWIARMVKRHGFRLRTYVDTHGRRIIAKERTTGATSELERRGCTAGTPTASRRTPPPKCAGRRCSRDRPGG